MEGQEEDTLSQAESEGRSGGRVSGSYGGGKSRMKMLLVLHYLLGAVHLARLLPSLLTVLGVTLKLPLPETPTPALQEYFWLFSLPFTLLALSACRRSNSNQLKMFQYIVLVACILPTLVTIATLAQDAKQFLMSGETEGQILVSGLGQPFPVLWSAFLLLCLVLHCLQLVVISGCLQAWAPRHGKRH